ncbi:F-box/LRR-repeat protein At1g67190-like isoform X1 [Mercurialis annua]|uniref:F-box/LRR-repeat protein At1g67190-like isoform X1 n=1 Tax=Mercurialis annua TaxID=3986 RepID=UPI00215EB7F8|nr:F-box/LRR-repeat protein At1g67190-like isoform X1 [Mercurialis annua]XP_055961609.1 F-box/LRR-repeat protein At1g67190-like isoform X1 [Mercurialis annua]
MENLPVEIVGNILSRVSAARDVVIASTTCKKWREACRTHVHTLVFHSYNWSGYHELGTSNLENLITRTIFQTTCLHTLSIIIESDEADEFSAASVFAWLMYTRKSLRVLYCNVKTSPNIDILKECSHLKLEVLALAHLSISGVQYRYQKIPYLISLSLKNVSISALDLNLLLIACPNLEALNLVSPVIAMSESQIIMQLKTFTLKYIYVEAIGFDKFRLEADSLEVLTLKNCTLELFELVGQGSLRILKMDDVSIVHPDFGENTLNLEDVDISNFTSTWLMFYKMISKSSKLTRLRLWDIELDDEGDYLDSDSMFDCFPQLTNLSMDYSLVDDVCCYGLYGSYQFDNVVTLELGWTGIDDMFTDWVAGVLARCPHLRKLVICGFISNPKTQDECRTLAVFSSDIVRLMRKYVNVDIEFKYQ